MSAPKPALRDMWPERGLMVNPESPVGLRPRDSRPDSPNVGDLWFGPDGNTVWTVQHDGRDIQILPTRTPHPKPGPDRAAIEKRSRELENENRRLRAALAASRRRTARRDVLIRELRKVEP